MKEVFPIIPASSGPIWMFWGLAVFLTALVALFAYLAYSSRHATFEVSGEGLRIRGDLYGRLIPLDALIVEEVRIMDLTKQRDYLPRWRTNGTGMPGYSAGWFKLRNGEKSLLFVTDRRRVTYIPTRKGYSVMLSATHPETLRQALLEAAH